MWNGLSGLFLKLELGNIYNELNFSLPTNDVDQHHGRPPDDERLRLPLEPPGGHDGQHQHHQHRLQARAVGLPREHGLRLQPRDHPDLLGRDHRPDQHDRQEPALPVLGIFDNGLTYMNSAASIADVTDGTSNTILMGETLTGTWAEASSCCVRTTIDRPVNKPIQIKGVNYYTYWMSKHPGAVNFLKCDGSVSTVTNQINKLVLVKMMTRAGGEALSADQMK